MTLTTSSIAILVLIAVIASVLIGSINKKINMGILAFIFAFIIGSVLMGKSASTVIAMFPIKVLMQLVCITYFYGYAIENGTMQAIGDRVIYAFRNHTKLLPWGIMLAALIIAAAGGGGQMSNVVMAPIAFDLAKRAKIKPLLVYMAVVLGSPLGGTTFWSIGGVMSKSIAMSNGIAEDLATSLVIKQTGTLAIVVISYMLILYFVLKGYKVENVTIAKPQAMTANQKKTFTYIVIVIGIIIVPSLLNILVPNPVLKYLSSYVFEIQNLCLIAGTVCAMKGLGISRDIIKNQIPWNMILVVTGVGTLIAVASTYGVTNLIANWVSTSVPDSWIATAMCIAGGVVSFVSDGIGVCMPTFYPILASIAEQTGTSLAPMFLACTTAIWITSASPVSSGGFCVAYCPEESREKVFVQGIICMFIMLLWMILLSVLGVFKLFG